MDTVDPYQILYAGLLTVFCLSVSAIVIIDLCCDVIRRNRK